MEDWLVRHMHGVLIGIEVLWVAGFLFIFVLYFMIKRRIRARKGSADRDTPSGGNGEAP